MREEMEETSVFLREIARAPFEDSPLDNVSAGQDM